MSMPNLILVTTGGTIASRRDTAHGYVTASIGGHELLGLLPAPLPGVAVEIDEFCNVGSFNLDLDIIFRLTQRISAHLARPDVAGVVVTHGTDTMEESAFLADLLVASDKPCVFTGAQRNADEPDSDGPRNLAQALQLAASGLHGLGAMIMFEQEFHAARDATKTHTYRTGTFTSMEHGKLGEIDGERISLHRRPVLRTTIATERIEPAVDLIKLAIGADARFLRCALVSGARGIVIEGFGRGHVTRAVLDAVAEAVAAGVIVVVASRCPQGRTQPIYGGGGGGQDLLRAGALFAGDLTGIKARVLLAALLGSGASRETIAAAFDRLGG
jgi:L-asparaginase